MAMTLGYGTSEEFFFDEYQTLDLRDKRLDERARKIFVQLQNNLGSCIRRVFVEPKDARQAYDFFSNPKVTGSKLIEPHYQETIKRINSSGAKYILAIQADSTSQLFLLIFRFVQLRCPLSCDLSFR